MEEQNQTPRRGKVFLGDFLAGFAMGIAFIIPGFSGGSVAAILGVYEKLVGAVADIFKSFKKSVITLIPIALGLVLGAVSLLFPLGAALEAFPLPTVSLFVGLAIGGVPSITDRVPGKPSAKNITALLIPAFLALALSFLPVSAERDLFSLSPFGYLVLFLVGLLGSTALVVPGISGSMLLLILGYYNPLIKAFTEHLLLGRDILKSLLVLGSCALGIAVGFFLISIIMRRLLERYPRSTYYAIIGFVVGSLPTVYISTAKDAGLTLGTLPESAWHWIACVLLLALGVLISLSFTRLAKKKK